MTLRLTWALQHIPGLYEAAQSGKAVFGGVDSWLLYKLTGINKQNIIIKRQLFNSNIIFYLQANM